MIVCQTFPVFLPKSSVKEFFSESGCQDQPSGKEAVFTEEEATGSPVPPLNKFIEGTAPSLNFLEEGAGAAPSLKDLLNESAAPLQ